MIQAFYGHTKNIDSYYKQELLVTRLRILGNQTAQNMSINTALITQLSLQKRSTGYYKKKNGNNTFNNFLRAERFSV